MTTGEEEPEGEQRADRDEVYPGVTTRRRMMTAHVVRALQSFRRQIKSPGEHERDRQAETKEEHDCAHDPGRNLKEGKDLGRDLDEQPRDHDITDRDLVNVAAF